jgi:hypothetical protein
MALSSYNRKRVRGHSNCYANETEPFPINPVKASIPLVGGSTIENCKPLPALALAKQEWYEIGKRMGWLEEAAFAWFQNALGIGG